MESPNYQKQCFTKTFVKGHRYRDVRLVDLERAES